MSKSTTAPSFIKAAEDLKNFLRVFKGASDAIEALESVSRLEVAKHEYEAAIKKLTARSEQLQTNHKELEEKSAQLQKDADNEANKTVNDARLQAKSIIAKAERTANDITEKAVARKDELDRLATDQQAEIESRNAIKAELDAELADLEKRIDKAKASIAKILG